MSDHRHIIFELTDVKGKPYSVTVIYSLGKNFPNFPKFSGNFLESENFQFFFCKTLAESPALVDFLYPYKISCDSVENSVEKKNLQQHLHFFLRPRLTN